MNQVTTGQTLFVGKCEDETGNFSIPNVPAGTYQVVVWDISLLHIIGFVNVISDGINPIELGPINSLMWFGIQEHNVFVEGTDVGVPEQNVNLRFRDGTIYKAFPTDTTGFVPFQEIFPFFKWLVAEVDFARLKATGLKVTNDVGAEVTHDVDGEGKRNPAVSDEDGPVLTQAFQIMAGQNQKFEWYKDSYGANENGGISGTVTYGTTRAEDDPRFAAVEEWEPGIPRVQVSLYKDLICNSNGGPAIFPHCPEAPAGELGDGIADPAAPTAFPYTPVYADVDNHPLGNFPGPEDVDTNTNDTFDYGDAIMVSYTDSWDDNLPTGCDPTGAVEANIHGVVVPIEQCAGGLRTWNQAVPGVFDGGYAFGPEIDPDDINDIIDLNDATAIGADGSRYLLPATYIVKAATPPGYKVLKEEDRNVDFGLTPIPAILPPTCVGDDHTVPDLFSFLTQEDGVTPLPGVTATGLPDDNGNGINDDVEAPFAGEIRKLCDRKKVDLGSGQNAAAEFHLFTDVPKAARAVGLIGDDLANETASGQASIQREVLRHRGSTSPSLTTPDGTLSIRTATSSGPTTGWHLRDLRH